MRNKVLFLCGTPKLPKKTFYPPEAKQEPLQLWGNKQNINLKISDITRQMVSKLPSTYEDLIEIATYVYCADQTTPRGGSGVRDIGEHWRREFYFQVAVRNPKFWNQKSVKSALKDLLQFLSDDYYEFNFIELKDPPKFSDYLDFPAEDVGSMVDEVILFSGGLDSLAGAIEEIFNQNKKVALVSHRSVAKIYSKQKDLISEINNRCSKKMTYHVPIWIQKMGWKESDTSQRSRSFLYASIAATVAAMFNKDRIRFYENGITSINLPIAEQVIGARATRTTHPKAIDGFSNLFSLLTQKKFHVETPFQWKTKTDIIELIKNAGHADLIKHSVSCSHVFQMTKLHSHCGSCSQCIDRRLATIAAGCEEHDPKEMYKTDIFVGDRSKEGQDIILTESYVRTMTECASMTDLQFFTKHGELSRVFPYIPGDSDMVAGILYQLYKKNGQQVKQAQINSLLVYGENIVDRALPERCLMSQLFGAKITEDEYITLQEAANILGQHKGTISRLADQGHFTDNKIKGPGRKVTRNSVLLYKQKIEDKLLRADIAEQRKDARSIPDKH
jgi:7-cyano-7-deazaguanine synthase in queuosine biosynthesis